MSKKTIVIVLGNRLNDDGSISEIQKQRLQLALELEQLYNPDYFILSGGLANPAAGRTEAEAMYENLIKMGMNEEKLIKENDSLTTVQNAYYSAPIAKKLGAEQVIICTSPYHIGDPRYKAMESFINEFKDTSIAVMCYTRNL